MRNAWCTAALATCLLAAAAGAEEEKKPAATSSKEPVTLTERQSGAADSPLVKAAKKSRAARKKSEIRITDEDVKKSTGRVTVAPDLPPIVALPGGKQQLSAEEELKRLEEAKAREITEREAARQRVEDAEKKVASLERMLNAVTDAYYDEADPSKREDAIESNFNDIQKRLEEARTELQKAREAQAAATGARPR